MAKLFIFTTCLICVWSTIALGFSTTAKTALVIDNTTGEVLLSKDIDRPIDGVIKADDEESILNELEEYVITGELEKNINDFLFEYNNYTNKNGVWISGFFGSGKSHLLKILSLLLENNPIENNYPSEILSAKISLPLLSITPTLSPSPSKPKPTSALFFFTHFAIS